MVDFIYIYIYMFLIEVLLIYNFVLVSGVQHSDSVIYILFQICSLIVYYRILIIVPSAIQ